VWGFDLKRFGAKLVQLFKFQGGVTQWIWAADWAGLLGGRNILIWTDLRKWASSIGLTQTIPLVHRITIRMQCTHYIAAKKIRKNMRKI